VADNEPNPERERRKLTVSSKDISRRLKKAEGATVKHARRFVFRRLDNFRDVRRHIALWILAIGLIVGATGLQFYWYQEGYRTTVTAEGGTYAEAVQGPLDSLNPLFAQSSAEESASELIFSKLLRFDETGRLNYDLADSMKVSEDRKTYTLTIRADARWQDGLYVRARDVVYTVNTINNPATHSTITGWEGIKVKEVDPLTVSFELPAPYAPFASALEQLPVLPEHVLRDVEPQALTENNFSVEPIGSGPFAVRALQEVDATNGRKVLHLVRNSDYYRGAAKLDRLQLHVYSDSDAIVRALRAGEVNAVSDISVVGASLLEGSRYDVEYNAVNSGVYAIFNTASPVLRDTKVRLALQAATDTKALRDSLSTDIPALYLPTIGVRLDAEDMPKEPAYDMKRAASLLDEAGWKLVDGERKKDGESLRLSLVTTKNNDFEKVLVPLTAQWRELGVTITTNIVDPNDPTQNVAQDVLRPRQYDVLLYRLTVGGDPDVYAYWHSSQASAGLNFANYRSSISDEALVSARSRSEMDLRNAKYATFATQWLKDAPAIGLYQSTTQYVHTQGVTATADDVYFVSPVSRYTDILYWSSGERRVFQTP